MTFDTLKPKLKSVHSANGTLANDQHGLGLFPSVFNLAESAAIIANATCGDQSTEVYCQLDASGSVAPSNQECGICDATERSKAHPIGMAVDGRSDTWWQAPSLQLGPDHHFVTITIDLKNVSSQWCPFQTLHQTLLKQPRSNSARRKV